MTPSESAERSFSSRAPPSHSRGSASPRSRNVARSDAKMHSKEDVLLRRGKMWGCRLKDFLGLYDRTILFLVILLDTTVSAG